MTLPPKIRINTSPNFPALVKGSGPVTVAKNNGVWSVGLSFASLGEQSPPQTSFASDFLLVYDSIANTLFKMPLVNITDGSTLATGNMTFYVSTTGSDSNPGTLAAPFATWQHATIIATRFNYAGLYHPTINVEDGTYNITQYFIMPGIIGSGDIHNGGYILGNPTTPTNCVLKDISGAQAGIFNAISDQSIWGIGGFELDSPSSLIDASFDSTLFALTYPIALNDSTASGNCELLVAEEFATTFCRNITITVLATRFFALLSAFTYSLCEIDSCTVVFQAATTITDAGFVAFGYATDAVFGNIYTNFAGITGNKMFLSEFSSIETDNGLLSEVPGNSFNSALVDDTCAFLNANTLAAFFFGVQKSGIPTTANLSAGLWGVFKDTSGGGVVVAYNDAGTIKKVALT
jgi:hypothetical protein